MKKVNLPPASATSRRLQKGAALITVVMVSGLMLVGSAALLTATVLSSRNSFESETEARAYYAAESGVQATLNVLRGRVSPSPLLVTTSANDPGNAIDFRKAVTRTLSNTTGDTSTSPRLSRWLNYNYSPNGGTPDRVTLEAGTYSPMTGTAYSVTMKDLDSSTIVAYNTACKINSGTNSFTFGSGGHTATITFTNFTAAAFTAYPTATNRTFASVTVSSTGGGAAVPANTRFAIAFNMTAPYVGTATMRGTITAGTITNSSTGTVRLDFDSNLLWLYGGRFNFNSDPLTLNAPNSSGGVTNILGSVTAPEPQRIMISSTGYGPRGARKQLDVIVRKNHFNAFTAPATITLLGTSDGFYFNPGSSNNETYSGDDVASTAFIPPIGVTNDTNVTAVNDAFANTSPPFNGNLTPPGPQNVANDLPDFLTSTTLCDEMMQAYRAEAIAGGRYFTVTPANGNFGNNTTGQGLTFVNGNATLTGDGGGLLLVTGTLVLKGNFNFNGLILVLGQGRVERDGGGNGTIQGNVIIGQYDPANPGAGFGASHYDMDGGGNSTVVFNSNSNANTQNAFTGFIVGVAEK